MAIVDRSYGGLLGCPCGIDGLYLRFVASAQPLSAARRHDEDREAVDASVSGPGERG